MYRLLIGQLLTWKNAPSRKPLLLDGARQVGKSYLLIEKFGQEYFKEVHVFDFLKNPHLNNLFKQNLDPQQIIRSLEITQSKKINLSQDLIVFDEIGEAPWALNSLKYFCQDMPTIYLVASGSNIGLLNSFPVGKVTMHTLYPMNFYEFLLASRDELIIEAFNERNRSSATHHKLWKYLLDYFYTGGMPEVVAQWFANKDPLLIDQLHQELLHGYQRDFGKYSNKIDAMHIERVFNSIGPHLQATQDHTTKRFRFKGVIPNKKRYQELIGPIDWLEKSKLISKNFIIEGTPNIPLIAHKKENFFKLFLFDIGILRAQLALNYNDIILQQFNFKGFIAENFVQNELLAMGVCPTFSWQEHTSELEFLLSTNHSQIIPLEVKSGIRTKAKSLKVFLNKYSPPINIKLTGKPNLGNNSDLRYPLYYTWWLKDIINN